MSERHMRYLNNMARLTKDPNVDWVELTNSRFSQPEWTDHKTVPNRWENGTIQMILGFAAVAHYNAEAFAEIIKIVEKISDMDIPEDSQ